MHRILSALARFAKSAPLFAIALPLTRLSDLGQWSYAHTLALHNVSSGLALGIVQSDTTPTLTDMVAAVSPLVGAWGIYIAAGLIFGLAVFAVYRFVRAGR